MTDLAERDKEAMHPGYEPGKTEESSTNQPLPMVVHDMGRLLVTRVELHESAPNTNELSSETLGTPPITFHEDEIVPLTRPSRRNRALHASGGADEDTLFILRDTYKIQDAPGEVPLVVVSTPRLVPNPRILR